MEKPHILIIDDEDLLFKILTAKFGSDYRVEYKKSGKSAIQYLSNNKEVSCILLDKNFKHIPRSELLGNNPEREGLVILREIRSICKVPVIMITSYADPPSLVEALKLGADDYIEYEAIAADISLLKHRIERTLKSTRYEEAKLIDEFASLGVIGKSKKMIEVFKKVKSVAPLSVPVLITGSTGTGKELIARTIHKLSGRIGEFIPVNISAVPETLLESELLGYKRGAFTGATRDHPGYIKMAEGGTLFIDELGDISPNIQAKLLRIMEDKEFIPVGGVKKEKVNTRFVFATNKNIERLVSEGKFREDLYYRVKVYSIHLPDLKERKEDISELVEYILTTRGPLVTDRPPRVTREALQYLKNFDWPGNVRQLENVILRCLVDTNGIITLKDVVKALESKKDELFINGSNFKEGIISNYLSSHTLKEIEERAILETVKRAKGDLKKAASMLGIGLSTLYVKLNKIKGKQN